MVIDAVIDVVTVTKRGREWARRFAGGCGSSSRESATRSPTRMTRGWKVDTRGVDSPPGWGTAV
jgi:hypothetical protein